MSRRHNFSAFTNEQLRQRYLQLYVEMYELCQQASWGDPFNYSRSREIHLANTLGHTIASTLSGADAIDEDGECEYKTTIGQNISATYNGISVQPTWDEQLSYLQTQKICKYKNHYFARYEGPLISEVWKMSCEKVLDGLLPSLERQFNSENRGRDPRLGATLSMRYIRTNAERLNINQEPEPEPESS
jgi:hypothetical protein